MGSEPLTEKIRQCQQGRADAFAWLLCEYGPRLYGYFVRRTGSTVEAEDLLQEMFLKLLQRIRDYRHEGRFEPWLFRVAANMIRDRGRKLQRQSRALATGIEPGNPLHRAADPTDKAGDPGRNLELSEDLGRMQEALGELPELDREIILLRFYGGIRFKDIAEQFQIPVGTAIAKVHRGLKKLKRMMTEND